MQKQDNQPQTATACYEEVGNVGKDIFEMKSNPSYSVPFSK